MGARSSELDSINMPLAAAAAAAAVALSSGSASTKSTWRQRRILSNIFRLMLKLFPVPGFPCRRLALPPGPSDSACVVLGTLYGYRKGHVHIAVQKDPKSLPVVVLELATPTSALIKEMSSGLMRIALECEKRSSSSNSRCKLVEEPVWSMFCNGRKAGYALKRACNAQDSHILSLVQSVSMGAGVLPMDDKLRDGELMYMRAKFERVVGSRDSEALYMVNPDGTGAPELSIFFLRI